ncbi:unnamed protein product, partial [Brenthis ino]
MATIVTSEETATSNIDLFIGARETPCEVIPKFVAPPAGTGPPLAPSRSHRNPTTPRLPFKLTCYANFVFL